MTEYKFNLGDIVEIVNKEHIMFGIITYRYIRYRHYEDMYSVTYYINNESITSTFHETELK